MQTKLFTSVCVSLVVAIAVASSVAPTHASSGGGSKKKTETVKDGPSVPSVNMPMLVAPVMIKGELVRYAYLGIKLILPDDSNKMMLLEKMPYIQDAFLREVHGATIALGEDPDVLDEVAIGRRLLNVCAEIVGPDIVKKVEFTDSAKDFK